MGLTCSRKGRDTQNDRNRKRSVPTRRFNPRGEAKAKAERLTHQHVALHLGRLDQVSLLHAAISVESFTRGGCHTRSKKRTTPGSDSDCVRTWSDKQPRAPPPSVWIQSNVAARAHVRGREIGRRARDGERVRRVHAGVADRHAERYERPGEVIPTLRNACKDGPPNPRDFFGVLCLIGFV